MGDEVLTPQQGTVNGFAHCSSRVTETTYVVYNTELCDLCCISTAIGSVYDVTVIDIVSEEA